MKTILILLLALTAGFGVFAQTGKNKKTHSKIHSVQKSLYTCPMHPEVVRNEPGKCPKCGMTLVAVKAKTKKS